MTDASSGTTPTSVTTTDSTPTTGTTPTNSPTPSGPPDVSFVGYGVQRSAFYRRHPDFETVWAPRGRQLLFAMVTVEGGQPTDLPFEDVSLRIDDRTVGDAEGVEGQGGRTYYPYPDECEATYETYATFPLPAPSSPSTAEVRWGRSDGTRTWSLPDDALAALGQPTTDWELVSFDVPDSVGPGESFSVAMEARNVGDAPGKFRGVLNQEGPMYGVSAQWKRTVSPGSTIRRADTIDVLKEIDADVSAVKLRLRTVAGDVDHEVRVE
jgi:hypothetical protein